MQSWTRCVQWNHFNKTTDLRLSVDEEEEHEHIVISEADAVKSKNNGRKKIRNFDSDIDDVTIRCEQ